ncbi:MAG: hypothetical protein J6D79_00485, partial [Clostridia bacterium]|nr:hypothetical protein [Clostridia bacterium]
VLSAYIVKNSGKDLLVTAEDGLYFVSLSDSKVYENAKEIGKEELKAGMSVQIVFDGVVLESYPGQITADIIKVTGETQDKISLFEKVLEEFFNQREDYSWYKTVALDFTKLSVSEPQKNALEYVFTNYLRTKTNADVIRSTREELEKEGKLKDGIFENGVILSIKENENSTYDFRAYTGPLGAEGSTFKAKMKNGEWKIDYTGYWIS